jgi:DNA-binding CsgD family transcriptional regulator
MTEELTYQLENMQFLLGITLPDDNAIEKAINLSSNLADPLEWLTQLKILFPELKTSLACIPNHGLMLPHPSRADSRNGGGNVAPHMRLLKCSKKAEVMSKGNGFQRLSSRQRAAIGLLSQGYSYREIAASMGLHVSTVRTHLHSAYTKLGAKSGRQALAKIFQERKEQNSPTWVEANDPPCGREQRCLA